MPARSTRTGAIAPADSRQLRNCYQSFAFFVSFVPLWFIRPEHTMSDDLLPYYNRELSYLRRHAARFAEAHPKVAARLRLGPDGSEDPHVERLLQGFAYLTARVRHKLDDEFPEVTQAILGVLYPHYLAPIPSFAIVQLDLDEGQNELV